MAKKVLVVDDEVSTVKFISVALEENGYETIAAYNGREGLEAIQNNTPDLAILDVMMPKKTGFTLFQQLKRDENFKKIPVIMLTGVADVLEGLDEESDDTHERPFDSLREAMRTKIQQLKSEGDIKPDVFIDKPVDPEHVVAKVRELIGE